MIISVARVATDHPARYIRQLVHHLSQRVTTELSADGTGLVQVEHGGCTLAAGRGVLVIAATADDAQTMRRVQDVVGRNLERFGRPVGLRVRWADITPAGSQGDQSEPVR
jgi:uncharacterized protein